MIANFIKPDSKDLQIYLSFYDQHAPRLWGRILSADLPEAQAKAIMIRTFVKAWRHPRRQAIREDQVYGWLICLAYKEGMPPGTMKTTFELA